MKFQVPQFIEVEDKIFGPFTFKQFVYLVGGAGSVYILWSLFPPFLAIIFIVPVAGLALALAFYNMNGRPFIVSLEAGLEYYLKNKLYIWKKVESTKPKIQSEEIQKAKQIVVPKLTEGKLKDIAWSLDIKK
jgi:hypothetical protein